MRTFRVSIVLAVCVAVAALVVDRAKAQYGGGGYGQPTTPQPATPQPAAPQTTAPQTDNRHRPLEYATLVENDPIGDLQLWSFNLPSGGVNGQNVKEFAGKMRCDPNYPSILNAIGRDGWGLVCVDHDGNSTTWYFDRMK